MPPTPAGGEGLTDDQLHEVLEEQKRALGFSLLPDRLEFERAFHGGVDIVEVQDEKLYGRVPARVDVNSATRTAVVNFDIPTFLFLSERLLPIYHVSPRDLAGIYIGSGLALKILESRLSPHKPLQVERLLNVMTSRDSLEEAIRTSDGFSDEQLNETLLSVWLSDEERLCRINSLRFAVGLLFVQPRADCADPEVADGIDPYEAEVSRLFRDGLKLTLRGKSNFTRLYMGMGYSEEEAERFFAEEISELEVAISFPMRWQELRRILDICKT